MLVADIDSPFCFFSADCFVRGVIRKYILRLQERSYLYQVETIVIHTWSNPLLFAGMLRRIHYFGEWQLILFISECTYKLRIPPIGLSPSFCCDGHLGCPSDCLVTRYEHSQLHLRWAPFIPINELYLNYWSFSIYSVCLTLSAGGVIASILVVACLFWVGLVDEVGFQTKGTVLNLSSLPVAIGLYGYCYSGHAVFPNIYTSMAKPSQFPTVLLTRYTEFWFFPLKTLNNWWFVSGCYDSVAIFWTRD